MKKRDHYREILRLVSGIGRLTNPQHLPMLREEGISLSQFLVLDALAHAQAPLRMAELARLSGLTTTELTRVMAKLEADSLVARQADPEDNRARLAELTEPGRRLHRGVQQQATHELRGVWNDFTHEEWHRFIDYLARFEAALRRERRASLTKTSESTKTRRKETP